jgi:hypothetical protein
VKADAGRCWEALKTVIVVTTLITMTVTAYTSYDEGMRGDGITTSGLQARDGFCACGDKYGFGTLFAIPALGRFFI